VLDADVDVDDKAVDTVVEKVGKAGVIIMDPGIGRPAYFWDVFNVPVDDDEDRDFLRVDTLFDDRKEGSIDDESVVREECGSLGVVSPTALTPDPHSPDSSSP
jgi:hypothetical protein